MNNRFDESFLVDFDKSDFNDSIKELIGKPVAVLCQRFYYRGILAKMDLNGIVLSKARAILNSGPSAGDTPVSEETIGRPVFIMRQSIELVFQPNWCFAPLD